MKYVIFRQDKGGVLLPVIIPDHVTHSSVTIEGATVDSAGHFSQCNDWTVHIREEPSESLGVGPNPIRDTALLENALNNSGIYAFLIYDAIPGE